jgi:lipoate-protein ligase A
MIKPGSEILCTLAKDKPAEELIPLNIVLGKSVINYDAIFYMCNPDRQLFEIGSRANLHSYDFDKMKENGVAVGKRPYSGTGALIGRTDITYSVHVNKLAFANGAGATNAFAFKWISTIVKNSFRNIGIDCELKKTAVGNRRDPVCMAAESFFEIVDKQGNKLHSSITSSDELMWSYAGHIFMTDEWRDIYQYINAPTQMLTLANMTQQTALKGINIDIFFNSFMKEFSKSFDKVTVRELSPREIELEQALIPKVSI